MLESLLGAIEPLLINYGIWVALFFAVMVAVPVGLIVWLQKKQHRSEQAHLSAHYDQLAEQQQQLKGWQMLLRQYQQQSGLYEGQTRTQAETTLHQQDKLLQEIDELSETLASIEADIAQDPERGQARIHEAQAYLQPLKIRLNQIEAWHQNLQQVQLKNEAALQQAQQKKWDDNSTQQLQQLVLQAAKDPLGVQAELSALKDIPPAAEATAESAGTDSTSAEATAENTSVDSTSAEATAENTSVDSTSAEATAESADTDNTSAEATAENTSVDSTSAEATAESADTDSTPAQAPAESASVDTPARAPAESASVDTPAETPAESAPDALPFAEAESDLVLIAEALQDIETLHDKLSAEFEAEAWIKAWPIKEKAAYQAQEAKFLLALARRLYHLPQAPAHRARLSRERVEAKRLALQDSRQILQGAIESLNQEQAKLQQQVLELASQLKEVRNTDGADLSQLQEQAESLKKIQKGLGHAPVALHKYQQMLQSLETALQAQINR